MEEIAQGKISIQIVLEFIESITQLFLIIPLSSLEYNFDITLHNKEIEGCPKEPSMYVGPLSSCRLHTKAGKILL